MPIYKGSNTIGNIFKGGQTIGNVYKGSTPIFSNVQYPYRVRISGAEPINTYSSAFNKQPTVTQPSLYFSIDNASNVGSYWYGIVLNSTGFDTMLDVTNNQTSCSISKEAWYNFISLWIGYNVDETDFTNFNINDPFYALNLDEWNLSTSEPKDPTNTHGWIFTQNSYNFNLEYKVLDSQDFYHLNIVMQGNPHITQLQLAPLGTNFSGWLQVDVAFLITSNNLIFNYRNLDMPIEWLLNNGSKVGGNLIQSNTNNFSFTINSMIMKCLPEVMQLQWNLSVPNINLLQIVNYTPPDYNITGSLELQLVSLNESMGENE